MNFSELVPHQNAAFSHQGDHLAISKDNELFVSLIIYLTYNIQIYDADKLTIVHRFQTPCAIEQLKWSPDDSFIMCINLKKCVIHLRTITNEVIEMNLEGWSGSISDDILAGATWTPDSR